jgi:phosphotransferase system, enzyme I, PtsP
MTPGTRKPAGKAARKTERRSPSAARSQSLRVLEHVSELAAKAGALEDTLQRIVEVIAQRTDTDVCSIYLLDDRDTRLTLVATTGLDHAAIGKVTMSVGEGLSGMVAEKGAPVLVVDAIAHPRYKYFPETGEERYHSFAGFPVVDRGALLGVLVVQTLRPRKFIANETRLLRALAGQVAGLIVNARLVTELKHKEKERLAYRRRMQEAVKRLQAHEKTIEAGRAAKQRGSGRARLSGVAAAPGFGQGRAHILSRAVSFDVVEEERSTDPAAELARFGDALRVSREQVATLKERLADRLPEFDVTIVEAHRMMLEDEGFIGRIESLIRDESRRAESALKSVVDEYLAAFAAMQDEYLRERSGDVKDVGLRLLRNLLGIDEPERSFDRDTVLVADEVTISELVLLDHENLRGIVLATGGATSHATILAKSFEIPTVVGAANPQDQINEGDHLLVDGNAGVVFVNPPADVAREYDRLSREYWNFNRELDALRTLPAETTDEKRVRLYANIGLIADVQLVLRHGADGVGLYRTEFPFLTYREFPDEQEQFQLYTRVIRSLEGRSITLRTLDLGADKYPSYLHLAREENPFLGWRSIRISLEIPALFKTQIRAILRAAVHGNVRIMLPMISGIEEMRRARELIEQVKVDLEREGVEFSADVPVGMMVEVPSAVALATHLIREADFFSIGTNDLIQYMLAVDRNNHKVSPLYEPLHPAVLGAIHDTVQAAKAAGKWVGICGEMASDPLCTLVLLGMGLDDLSMSPFFVPPVKRIIRSVSQAEVRALTRDVLSLPTVKEVKGYLFDGMKTLGILELMEMYH